MNKGSGPMRQLLADMDKNVPIGDANWATWFGQDKSKWVFNTECCADQVNYQNAKCGAPVCQDKCDVTGECGNPQGAKCADLVKQYPCEQYYAPGKAYAGWCDKQCGYGSCHSLVFQL